MPLVLDHCQSVIDALKAPLTKNGGNPGQPWVLMKLTDVLVTYFAPQKSGRMLCLRHKPSSEL